MGEDLSKLSQTVEGGTRGSKRALEYLLGPSKESEAMGVAWREAEALKREATAPPT